MPRPLKHHSIADLEKLVDEKQHEPLVLREVLDELRHRSVPRARELSRLIRGLLGGSVPVRPAPPPADSPKNQLDLLDRKG